MYNLLFFDSHVRWQRGEPVACEEQHTEVWQNPQITDGLLSQAVEGKVQELPCKTKDGITEATYDNDAQTRERGKRALLPPLLTSGDPSHALHVSTSTMPLSEHWNPSPKRPSQSCLRKHSPNLGQVDCPPPLTLSALFKLP